MKLVEKIKYYILYVLSFCGLLLLCLDIVSLLTELEFSVFENDINKIPIFYHIVITLPILIYTLKLHKFIFTDEFK